MCYKLGSHNLLIVKNEKETANLTVTIYDLNWQDGKELCFYYFQDPSSRHVSVTCANLFL